MNNTSQGTYSFLIWLGWHSSQSDSQGSGVRGKTGASTGSTASFASGRLDLNMLYIWYKGIFSSS